MDARAAPADQVDTRPAMLAGGVWAGLADRIGSAGQSNVWRAVAEQLDLGAFVPTPCSGIDVGAFPTRDGVGYRVLRSPAQRYLRLDAEDFALWTRMNGRESVREIATAHFLATGSFAAARLTRLVGELRAGGFLGTPPIEVFALIRSRLHTKGLFGHMAMRFGRAMSLPLYHFRGADAAFATLYQWGGRLAFTRPALMLWTVLVLGGLLA